MTQEASPEAAGNLFAQVSRTPAVQSLARRLEIGGVVSCAGICQPAQPFLAVLLRQCFPHRPLVLVTDSLKIQELVHQDVETWLHLAAGARQPESAIPSAPGSILPSPSSPLFFPPWDVLPHEGRLPHADTVSDRLETLVALAASPTPASPPPLVVTSVTALLQKTFAPGFLREHTRALQRGDRVDPLDLVEWLEDQGYDPEAQVTQKGEIALRGGILDVFPLTSPWPIRLEFFGDELESLRHFDPLTQISRGEIPQAILSPGGELGMLKTSPPGAHPREPAEAGLGTLLDHLARETLFILCETERLAEHAAEYAQQVPAGDPLFVPWNEFLAAVARRRMTQLELSEDPVPDAIQVSPPSPPASVLEKPEPASAAPLLRSLDAFRPRTEHAPELQIADTLRREFFNQLHRWLRQDYTVHVFCNNAGERQRFGEIWRELGLVPEPGLEKSAPGASGGLKTQDSRLEIHVGTLSSGFLCDDARLAVVTDAEIFGRYRVQRPRRLKPRHALAPGATLEINFTDLEEGDLVVHLQYGIGRYLGLKQLPATPRPTATAGRGPAPGATECLAIEYAPSRADQPPPKLYVPVTEAHLVSKYVGAGKARPPLNTLGGTRWAKAREQAERAVRDVAAELLAIQAARESQPGHPFAPDTPWQREFESAFIYEETPDQLRSIAETKADMERPKPMDRLICGDAGFGKTEVAIRAAFKAVMDGRQVAVLVPTTVLAQQHFNTFRERMADYPVRLELLSRFRTRRQQQRVVKELASGAVDIVIGTHRLLQADLAFKDLGLVVIDEEQRFGVLHKEKFKRLRTLVDVLTLSATPIPRTLYLALTGARDMSTIQTPPHDRLPVETLVAQYDERVVRDAIQRELNRGGQVYFLHNRVMTIDRMADRLRKLLPQARIAVGHGQMPENELEEVMTRFVNGEADVLLSTTIVESGLDIPNANTIIIDRADRFGLSDLYQLRGRVGRYKHQAYAYLLLPRHARLLTEVRKRISAIRQYSTLGSGFKIAMRDLEIRGAGNLLGAEQSGHITAVGFELYCQLLTQSISTLKGETVKPRVDVEVRLDFIALNAMESEGPSPPEPRNRTSSALSSSEGEKGGSKPQTTVAFALLPHNYVPEPQHRIEIYRKLAQATDATALDALGRELRDRFGPRPPPVDLLLQLAELKTLAAEKGITAIEVQDDKLMLTRQGDFITLGGKFPRLTKRQAGARLKEIRKLLLAI